MQVDCPRCGHRFEQNVKARNLRCPECSFEAPSPRARALRGDEVECPRCHARTRSRPGAKARCRQCGYRATVPAPRTEAAAPADGGVGPRRPEPEPADGRRRPGARLDLECPRCQARIQARAGQQAVCTCGFEAEVPAGLELACPRCGARLVGIPGMDATCDCGFSAAVPSA